MSDEQRLSRRRLLAATASLAAAGAAGVALHGWRHRGWPRFSDGQPKLRMPFPAGTVVLCEQGNASRHGTHATDKPQNTFALDFSNRVLDVVEVVAAARGTVSFVSSGAAPDDVDAGAQYGNQVRIDHGGGFETLYAHLDSVSAIAGTAVFSGASLGTMGRSGMAGGRHLHFSLHAAIRGGAGATTSLPIGGVLSSEPSSHASAPFRWRGGGAFEADPSVPWRGHLYASENASDHDPDEGPRADLAARIEHARAALEAALDARSTLAELSRTYTAIGAAEAAAILAPILAQDPDDPAASYFQAVAVLMPAGRRREARELLERALRLCSAPRRFEPWLAPYAKTQLELLAKDE